MGRVLAVALASTCALAGCTLLAGTGGLTGGSSPTDGGTGSESQPQSDASGGDGDVTTPPGDAGHDASGDAPSDVASSDGPAGEAGTWCASHGPHFFCADFDEGSASAGWTNVDMATMQGTLGLSPQYVSPPASLLTSVPAHATGSAEARVVEAFPVVPSHVHVEFDMYTCGASTPGYLELAKIHEYTQATGVSGGIDLGVDGTNDYLLLDDYADDGGETTQSFKPMPAIAVDQWVHVALDVVLDPSNGSVILTLGTAPSVQQTGLRTIWPGVTSAELVIGLYSGGNSSPACEVDYDDVVVDYN
ncbi:MAG TPA: hypothetical protein VF765_35020 [Polyangiaceae bacterium]